MVSGARASKAWIADNGTLSEDLFGDAAVIEGRAEIVRYPDGTTGLVDLELPSEGADNLSA